MSARQGPRFTGSNSERQSVGDPGHCDRCAEVGHVKAHPELGCGDVGCNSYHAEPACAPYVPQVGDRVRPAGDPKLDIDWGAWNEGEYFDVIAVAPCWLFGFHANGAPGAISNDFGWVKVDKQEQKPELLVLCDRCKATVTPEPWPVETEVVRRMPTSVAHLGYQRTVEQAVVWATKWVTDGADPSDIRIEQRNPDGSVTVLDHEGQEL